MMGVGEAWLSREAVGAEACLSRMAVAAEAWLSREAVGAEACLSRMAVAAEAWLSRKVVAAEDHQKINELYNYFNNYYHMTGIFKIKNIL